MNDTTSTPSPARRAAEKIKGEKLAIELMAVRLDIPVAEANQQWPYLFGIAKEDAIRSARHVLERYEPKTNPSDREA